MSAIIAVYNGERFVGESIASVLAQTWDRVECIVVDDGSTDGTADIVRGIVDERLRYLYQPNGGVSSARNAGIEAAHGDLIAFLDADDIWLPDKTALQVECFRRRPDLGLVCGAYTIVDERLNERTTILPDRRRFDLSKQLLLEGSGIGLSFTGMVARHALDASGAFDTRFSTSADLEFAARVARVHAVEFVEQPVALYRAHPGQMHLNLEAFERDMLLIWDDWFPATGSGNAAARRRAEANLYTRLFFYELLRRRYRSGWSAFAKAARRRPDRLIALPAWAVLVRGRRKLARRRARRQRS